MLSYIETQSISILLWKGTFVYNPDGLPDNLTYPNPGLGNLNYYFVYDNQRRLKELQIGYNKSQRVDGVRWHRYGYNNLNQIVKDTRVDSFRYGIGHSVYGGYVNL